MKDGGIIPSPEQMLFDELLHAMWELGRDNMTKKGFDVNSEKFTNKDVEEQNGILFYQGIKTYYPDFGIDFVADLTKNCLN